MHVFLRQRTVVVSWMWTTVEDGHRFSAVKRLSRRLLNESKNAFTYFTCICSPPRWGWSHRNFVQMSYVTKLNLWAIVRRCFRDPKFIRFDTIPDCHGRTDGRTRDDSKYRASI